MHLNKKRKSSHLDTMMNSDLNNFSTRRSESRHTNPQSLKKNKSKDELDVLYNRKVLTVKAKYEMMLKKNPKKQYYKEINNELKRCEVCFDFENNKSLLLCDYCDDGYHMYCLKNALDKKPIGGFTCPNCIEHLKKSGNVPTKLKGINKTIRKIVKKCNGCKENIKERARSVSMDGDRRVQNVSLEDDSLKNCFKCLKDFHLKCFRKDWEVSVKGKCKIICDNCEKSIQTKLLKITRISDYFKPQKNSKIVNGLNIFNDNSKISLSSSANPNKIRINFNNGDESFSEEITNRNKNEAKLKMPKELTKEQKRVLHESLFRAMEVKGCVFKDDLNFEDPDCPESMNNSLLEVGIQPISHYNKEIYYKVKERTRKAEYPPLEVIDDALQGFIVKATDDIPMLTLICEYAGDVSLTRNKIFDKNDSIFDLLISPSTSTSLVICPEKKSNIARFFSGINNYDGKGIKKRNVLSIKYDIDGSVHILLYASRTIKKNEILYYDYNAGGLGRYPTEHFI